MQGESYDVTFAFAFAFALDLASSVSAKRRFLHGVEPSRHFHR